MKLAAPTTRRVPPVPTIFARRGVLMGVGAAGVVCALVATWWPSVGWLARAQPIPTHDIPAWLIVVSLLPILAAVLALPAPPRRVMVSAVREDSRLRWLCAGLLALPALVAVLHWHTESLRAPAYVFTHVSSSWAAVLWLCGIATALLITWPPRGADEPAGGPLRWVRSPRRALEAFAVLVILVVAAALRLWHLGSQPEGIWFDEVDSAHNAQQLLSLPFQPLAPGNYGHNPSLYFYVMALLLRIGGTTISMVRLTSALFGIVAVVAVYLLGRKAGGPALGLCAAALLAVGQWAIDFSRIGMSNIAAPAMIGLGFVALAVAMERPRAFWFTLAGVLLGLSLLTYAGGFLAGVGVALAVVGIRVIFDAAYRRAALPVVWLLPLGLVVGAAPFLTAVWLNPAYTLGREQIVSLFNERVCSQWSHCVPVLLENVRRHLAMLTIAGDHNGRHNLPGAPMLDPIMGACFLLGLGICLRHFKHWFAQLLLLWLIASLLGGILSLDFEAPQGARTVGAVAPIALIAALPLALLAREAWRLTLAAPGWLARWQVPNFMRGGVPTIRSWLLLALLLAGVVVACPLGISAAHNINQYFGLQAANLDAWSAMDGQSTVIGRAAAILSQRGYTVLVDPNMQGDPVMKFAAGDLTLRAYDPGVPVPQPVPRGGWALIVPAESQEVLDYVKGSYPTATVVALTPDFDHTQVRASAILIQPEDVIRNMGITVTFGSGAQARTLTHQLGDVPWPAGSGPASLATLRGTLEISSAQSWQPLAFRLAGASSAVITIDGATWGDAALGTPAICLGAGSHALRVSAQGKAAPSLELQFAPGTACSRRDHLGAWRALSPLNLAAPELPTGGLLGFYYNGPVISGQPAMVRVDATVNTYYQVPPRGTSFPFAAQWSGDLRITQSGAYAFKLASTGPSVLVIDGAKVVSSPSGGNGTGSVTLQPGRHRVLLTYLGTGSYLHCYLTWAPPGMGFAPIPPSATEPAHG